jgi:uncharacterized membrane protein
MSSNRKAVQWLLRELPELEKEQVINKECSDALKKYYEDKLPPAIGIHKIMLIFFSILSAVLIGGGVILIIAYNWDDLPKSFRSVMAFIPLVLAIITGWYTLFKDKDTRWKEVSSILLAASSASAISLVSQIYHLGGTLPDFLFVWLLLILLPIYIFNSGSLLFIYLWAFTAYDFACWGSRHNIYYLLMFFGLVLPYFIWHMKKHSETLRTAYYNWLFVALVLINFGATFKKCSNFELQTGFALLLATIYLIGMNLREKGTGFWRNPFLPAGFLGTVIFVSIGTFSGGMWDSYHYRIFNYDVNSIVLLSVWGLMLICDLHIIFKRRNVIFFIPALLPVLTILSAWLDKYTMAYIFSGYMLLLGAALLTSGYKQKELFRLNLGMLVVSLLIILRFVDSDLSILMRGCAFIAVGIAFAIINWLVGKSIKTTAVTEVK